MRNFTRHSLTLLGLGAILWASASVAQAQKEQHWIATWGTAQQLMRGTGVPGRAPGTPAPTPTGTGPQRRFAIPPGLPSINNQTIRMFARTSVGGSNVRFRFYNALGGATVRFGGVRIALRQPGTNLNSPSIEPKSSVALSFGGQPDAVLYAGQTLLSDPVRFTLPALADLAVSIYVPNETAAPTVHLFGLRTTFVSKPGDETAAASFEPATTTESYYWLAGVDVLAPADAGTLVTFGDSITDGDQSTLDANGAWPTLLAQRMQANPATRQIGVVNVGISGNRVLGDGQSALVRMTHDVLSQPGIKWMTLMEGINDINGGTRAAANPKLKAEDLIRAYQQILARAHGQGVRVIGCTIIPWGGSTVFNDLGEAVREQVNTWIRTSKAFDAVVDFDAVLRDPKDPKRMRPEADSPDMVHPGDAGYKMMADAFDLTLFAQTHKKKK